MVSSAYTLLQRALFVALAFFCISQDVWASTPTIVAVHPQVVLCLNRDRFPVSIPLLMRASPDGPCTTQGSSIASPTIFDNVVRPDTFHLAYDSGYNHESFCDYIYISMDAYMGSGGMFGYGDYEYMYGSYTLAMNLFVHSGCAL